ncbi:MAG: hypothetical protein ABI853_03470 [Sphingomicrobium sp.]
MTSAESSGTIGRAAYEKAFPRVSDALTLYVWRSPAFVVTRAAAAAAAGIPAITLTLLEALLAGLVFLLFWTGRYWPGLLVALAVMLVSVAGMMLSRLGHAPVWANRLRLAVEVVAPLSWWWAWAHGLAAYGRPLEPVYATMVLWVVVGGTVALRAIEALALHRFNGMEIHAWRPLDSRFRLVSAGRNPNLVILTAALLLRRPDTGLVLVAWWTLISLIFHAVRLAQLTERQAQRQKVTSWLER